MTDFRQVTDDFYVAPQLSVRDITHAAEQGFQVLIMNRPDGETPDQPPLEDLTSAMESHGLVFEHIPLSGPPSMDKVEDTEAVLKKHAPQKILAFCRSGTRSITLWALSSAKMKSHTPEDILTMTSAAGYDLSGLVSVLKELYNAS